MWNCEDSTEVNAPRLQNNYCVVESMWSCSDFIAETVNVELFGFHSRNSQCGVVRQKQFVHVTMKSCGHRSVDVDL